jgi:hypothetical protein
MTAINLIQPVGDQMLPGLIAMAVAIVGTIISITLVTRALFNVFRSWS